MFGCIFFLFSSFHSKQKSFNACDFSVGYILWLLFSTPFWSWFPSVHKQAETAQNSATVPAGAEHMSEDAMNFVQNIRQERLNPRLYPGHKLFRRYVHAKRTRSRLKCASWIPGTPVQKKLRTPMTTVNKLHDKNTSPGYSLLDQHAFPLQEPDQTCAWNPSIALKQKVHFFMQDDPWQVRKTNELIKRKRKCSRVSLKTVRHGVNWRECTGRGGGYFHTAMTPRTWLHLTALLARQKSQNRKKKKKQKKKFPVPNVNVYFVVKSELTCKLPLRFCPQKIQFNDLIGHILSRNKSRLQKTQLASQLQCFMLTTPTRMLSSRKDWWDHLTPPLDQLMSGGRGIHGKQYNWERAGVFHNDNDRNVNPQGH